MADDAPRVLPPSLLRTHTVACTHAPSPSRHSLCSSHRPRTRTQTAHTHIATSPIAVQARSLTAVVQYAPFGSPTFRRAPSVGLASSRPLPCARHVSLRGTRPEPSFPGGERERWHGSHSRIGSHAATLLRWGSAPLAPLVGRWPLTHTADGACLLRALRHAGRRLSGEICTPCESSAPSRNRSTAAR
jgi:hypothetical protein